MNRNQEKETNNFHAQAFHSFFYVKKGLIYLKIAFEEEKRKRR